MHEAIVPKIIMDKYIILSKCSICQNKIGLELSLQNLEK